MNNKAAAPPLLLYAAATVVLGRPHHHLAASAPPPPPSSFVAAPRCPPLLPRHRRLRYYAADRVIAAASTTTNGEDDRDGGDDSSSADDDVPLPSRSTRLFDEMTRELFGAEDAGGISLGGGEPPSSNPFASNLRNLRQKSGSSLGDLYGDEELLSVLSVHREIVSIDRAEEESIVSIAMEEEEEASAAIPSTSLHDLVMQAVGEAPESPPKPSSSAEVPSIDEQRFAAAAGFELDEETQRRMSNVRAIASDVDGTLLSGGRSMHPRTRSAVLRALRLASEERDDDDDNDGFYFFPATGKTRKGALDSLGIEIGSIIASTGCPGVYIQGLYCVDAEGSVVFEKKLSSDATAAAESLAREYGVSVVAYDGDDLYTTDVTDIVTHLHEHYGEPLPRLLPHDDGDDRTNDDDDDRRRPRALADHEPGMHKLLLMDDDVDKLSTEVRPKLEALADRFGATVTQALPTMLEWLPAGCSKAVGVARLCDALGIDVEEELLALGDAENDAEMLRAASIGVAMGNGCPLAKGAADFVMDETNAEGGAGSAMELFGFGGTR